MKWYFEANFPGSVARADKNMLFVFKNNINI